MTHPLRAFVLSTLGLLLACPLALSQTGDAAHGRRVGERARSAERGERRAWRHERHAQLMDRMQWTDAQRELALQEARAAQPIVACARQARERILIEARQAAGSEEAAAAREGARARLRELRESRRRELEPLADSLLRAMTPEQRRTLEERAERRGRTFTDERLLRRIERALARPRTVPKLEARLGR